MYAPKVSLQNDAYYYLKSSEENIANVASFFSIDDPQRIQDILETHALLESVADIRNLSLGQVHDVFTLATSEIPADLPKKLLKLTEEV